MAVSAGLADDRAERGIVQRGDREPAASWHRESPFRGLITPAPRSSQENTMAILEFEPATEDDRIILWRADELERAGYASEDVLRLALDPHVDLHLALDLVRRGCPHDVALRILV
jgi:hypothetical protein